MNLINLLETVAPATSTDQAGTIGAIAQFLPLIALVVVFYFIIYRPQKKQERETLQMRNSLMVGDEITTNGGIMGKVISIKDDVITIESGADRNKIKIRRWALHSIDKKVEGDRSAPAEEKTSGYKVKSVKKVKESVPADSSEAKTEE